MTFPEAWCFLRKWSALYRIALIALCGVAIAAALLHVPARSLVFLAPTFGAFALYIVAGSRLKYFPCPRCGARFIWGLGFFSMSLQSHCSHCGLPKYPESDHEVTKT